MKIGATHPRIVQNKAVQNDPDPSRVAEQALIKKAADSRLSARLSAAFDYTAWVNYAFTPLYSSETVSFFLPFARRAANTLRPFAVAILSRKPCLFFLFLLEG